MSLRGGLGWCSAAARDKNTRVVERILHADSRSIMVTRTPTSLILSLLVALPACGAEDKEEPEEVRVFERRRPTCEYFCGLAMDPDCGAQESSFADAQECVDYCVSEDAGYWRLQDDDVDACADEFVALYECAGEGTCEDQSILFNTPSSAPITTRCKFMIWIDKFKTLFCIGSICITPTMNIFIFRMHQIYTDNIAGFLH